MIPIFCLPKNIWGNSLLQYFPSLPICLHSSCWYLTEALKVSSCTFLPYQISPWHRAALPLHLFFPLFFFFSCCFLTSLCFPSSTLTLTASMCRVRHGERRRVRNAVMSGVSAEWARPKIFSAGAGGRQRGCECRFLNDWGGTVTSTIRY